MHFIGIAGIEGNEGCKSVVFRDHPPAVLPLFLQNMAKETLSVFLFVFPAGVQLLLYFGRDIGE